MHDYVSIETPLFFQTTTVAPSQLFVNDVCFFYLDTGGWISDLETHMQFQHLHKKKNAPIKAM